MAGWTRVRLWAWVKDPQFKLQSSQVVTMQLTGQPPLLHSRVSVSSAQILPPNALLWSACRWRVWATLPQDFVHADHAPNAESRQSIKQACWLPRFVAALLTWRVRVWNPAPHDFSQPGQKETRQSWGERLVLQSRDSWH